MIVEVPKTLNDFKKVRETIVQLMGNPYCDQFMFLSLSEKLNKTDAKIKELEIAVKHKKLTRVEIDSLYNRINTGQRYHVDTSSPRLVDELITIWFESQGLDFWTFPEVERWEVNEAGEIDFWYNN